jgi:hypothetical protein
MRKNTLVECNAQFATEQGRTCYVLFDCPEGHENCRHAIPFSPSLEGQAVQRETAVWQRTGTMLEKLTLSPSIRRKPRYPSHDAALAAGCIEEYITPSLLCALHIFVKDGHIEFCGDSR